MIIEQGWLTLLSPSNANTCFGRKCIFPGPWNPFQLPLDSTNQNNSRFTCIKHRLRHKRKHHSYSKCSLTWFFKWCQTCFLFNWGNKWERKWEIKSELTDSLTAHVIFLKWLLLPSLTSLLSHCTLFFSFMACLTLGKNLSVHLFSMVHLANCCVLHHHLCFIYRCVSRDRAWHIVGVQCIFLWK